jgi:phosphatidylserine/phosphatidylglycerophosphate/cardiolipin synthase-like enzyme
MGLLPIFSPCAPAILNLFDSQVQDVFIASAFLRIEAVSEMFARILKGRSTPCRLRILTGGSFSDILARASGIASLALLTKAHHSSLSIDRRRDPRLHSKIYIVDGCNAIITSANLTPLGLLTNIEFGLFVDTPDIVKNILNYLEPIWEMSERIDENTLDDLSSGAEEERSESLPKSIVMCRNG